MCKDWFNNIIRVYALKLGLHCLIFQVLNTKQSAYLKIVPLALLYRIKNLEHGLVTLTESFSPPRSSELHNLPCWSPKQKCALSYAIPFYTMYTVNSIKPVLSGLNCSQPTRVEWCKALTALLELSITSHTIYPDAGGYWVDLEIRFYFRT